MNRTRAQAAVDELQQWVSFTLGDETYAISVLRIQEVLRSTEVTPVAGAPHYVLGVINLRGKVVSVIDARRRFRLPTVEPTDETRIIMVEADDQTIGVMVDRVGEVLHIRQSEIEATPHATPEELSSTIRGVTPRDDELILIVDLDRLLADGTAHV